MLVFVIECVLVFVFVLVLVLVFELIMVFVFVLPPVHPCLGLCARFRLRVCL